MCSPSVCLLKKLVVDTSGEKNSLSHSQSVWAEAGAVTIADIHMVKRIHNNNIRLLGFMEAY